MAKLISDILDNDRVAFKHLIESWELRSGKQSHDVRLYSDMRTRAVSAVKQLGLDPTDTISGELYFALQERARQDNLWLEDFLRIKKDDSPEEFLKKISKWVLKKSDTKEVWVCKSSKLKTLLKKNPPKLLMKTLGLRSIDSMLKRTSVSEVLTLAYEIESDDWKNKFKQNYKKLKVTDFDINKVDIQIIDRQRVEKLKKIGFNESKIILPNNETGGLIMVAPQARFPFDSLAVLATLAESISDLRRHSSYYRTISVNKDFGQKFYDVSTQGIIGASSSISEIGWNSIHKHLIGNEDFFSRIEQPYITYNEFVLQPAVSLLSVHDPRFEFWKDLEYVFFNDKNNDIVSMNLIDVVSDASNRQPYATASKLYGKSRLWEELWARYLKHDDVAEEIVDKFLQV